MQPNIEVNVPITQKKCRRRHDKRNLDNNGVADVEAIAVDANDLDLVRVAPVAFALLDVTSTDR